MSQSSVDFGKKRVFLIGTTNFINLNIFIKSVSAERRGNTRVCVAAAS